MVVPQKRNHRGGLVGRERVSKRGSRGGLIRRPGRRRAPLRRRLTAPPTSVRRVRCSPAVDVATPMSATTPAAATTRPPVAATRIALVRLTSPISSCVEPHQDTHQEAHQKSVSAGHSVAWPSASKRRATASRAFSPRRASSSLAIPERADRQIRVPEHRANAARGAVFEACRSAARARCAPP